ncbi:MAG: UDP-N-acetylmuramoyl-L-alanine--D-glutamate ligase [Verrucomicrobiae bacterium]|nr:UDP-N-acetylmuramoyl-L-alanine--D-glutamate ligase [Verrucomicrobiae bacterium]
MLEVRDKDVAVLGLGRSGWAAAHLLRERGARVVVLDENDGLELRRRADSLRLRGIAVELGVQPESEREFDLAVLSPGIAPERPVVRVLGRRTPVLSEVELAYRHCACPVVAITGTNGKTTTTELMAQALTAAGQRTVACGNIGYPFSEAVELSRDLDYLVVEVSSFQLERIEQFRPRVAVWLNIRPDHMDRYRRFQDYVAAKARIFLNQTLNDTAVISAEVMQTLQEFGFPVRIPTLTFSAYNHEADLWLDWADGDSIWCRLPDYRGVLLRLSETQLRGAHNAENIMAVLAAGIALNLPVHLLREGIMAYRPQPHRCELVAVVDGVRYVNDSKATNVDAVLRALEAESGPVVLIAGGRDKGLDFAPLTPVLERKARGVILIGEAREKMRAAWGRSVECREAQTMEEAVYQARAWARAGDTVLLSPACASFDMFRDYQHRGEEFRRVVLTMAAENNPNQPTQGGERS